MVGLAVLLAGWYGYVSFGNKSLWWDETWALRQCSHGSWKVDKEGEQKFSPTTWKRCAFYYQKPTNHPSISLLQKSSLTVWRWVTGAQRHEFSEWAARLPAWFASGAAVVLLIRLVGIARGMVLLAVLLALHPWHLRYGVEARAYAMVVPLCLSGILASRSVLATRGRRLGPWVWLALNQALWIYSFIPAVLDVGILFLATGFMLWRQEKDRGQALGVVVRHIVAHVFAAMIWMQAFLPNLMQIPHVREPGNTPMLLDATVARGTASQLLFGMEWRQSGASTVEAEHLTSLVQTVGSDWGAALAMALAGGLALVGLATCLRRSPVIGTLLVAPLAAALVHAALSRSLGLYFYPRFIISVLPVVVAGWALCPTAVANYVQTRRRWAVVMALVFVWVTAGQRVVLGRTPYTAYRDVAEFVKTWEKPPVVVGFGLGREALQVYLPQIVSTSDVAELQATIVKAKEEGKECLVVMGYPFFHQETMPEGHALVRDPKQFRELKGWPGLEADFYLRVYQAL
jgi:hypothetical protein